MRYGYFMHHVGTNLQRSLTLQGSSSADIGAVGDSTVYAANAGTHTLSVQDEDCKYCIALTQADLWLDLVQLEGHVCPRLVTLLCALQDVNLDRFFNLLPFVSRMPRNQFFAELAGRLAHLCLASWSNKMNSAPKKGDLGIFNRRCVTCSSFQH